MTDVLPCVEIDAQGEPAGTVLWMHGLGASGHDFEPIVPLLELPQVRFVFPHAPARGVTINGGLIMPSWYDILALGTAGGEDADDVRESAAMIEALIAREGARESLRKHRPGRLQPGGRHGAVRGDASRETAARDHGAQRIRSRRANARSGDERSEPEDAAALLPRHARSDGEHRAGAGRLRRLPEGRPEAEWHQFPMGHEVCPPEIDVIRRWLAARFAR
jgi:phospholipase/carboxylesterase